MAEKKFKTNDRVKRKDKSGSVGTVIVISEDVTASDAQKNDKSYLYTVQWDSGTKSVFGVEGLEISA